ncbi:hypothetical protein [uncultured Pseudodesulfovibrio sp.]|uniref:DUF7483 domain-containing protein n=1 Tax=uncultured Pseudodesulfovibrio sp. TaxID=2035858 RepID=UPI0029C61909|nr:hypothetical protein [uncultured Pseudodesulfovibrio sp.]
MLTAKETGGQSGVFSPPIAYSALCEAGFISVGAMADETSMALGWKPSAVDTAYPLCDPTHHYLLTIRKTGTEVTVWKQDIELGRYTTSAATCAELLTEALAAFAGSSKGYVSRLIVAQSALDYTGFYRPSSRVPGLWVPRSPVGLTIHTRLDFTDAADLGADSSGNGYHWTLPGASQSMDTPSNNHCTFNPLDPLTVGTLSDGNLTTTGDATVTMHPTSGQWYYERNGVGVSYDADANGPFNPVLGAGTYNFGATAWNGIGPVGNECPLCDSCLPEPGILDSAAHYHVSMFIADGSAQAIEVGFDAEGEDWLLVLKGLGSQPWYWINTVCGLNRFIDPASAAGESGLSTPVSVSGSTITLPADILTGGTAYSVMVLKVGADTGFDIVTYTGDGATPHMVNHALGQIPFMFAVFGRSAASDKSTYWEKCGPGKRIDLAYASGQIAGVWGGTSPTSAQFAVAGTYPDSNAAGSSFVAFLFARTEVVREFGYVGNGSGDGPFCATDGAIERIEFLRARYYGYGWNNLDTVRDPANVMSRTLRPHEDAAEAVADALVMTSIGFKPMTAAPAFNADGEEYLGLALGRQTKYRNAF